MSEANFKQEVIDCIKELISPYVKYSIYFEEPSFSEPFCEVVRTTFDFTAHRGIDAREKLSKDSITGPICAKLYKKS